MAWVSHDGTQVGDLQDVDLSLVHQRRYVRGGRVGVTDGLVGRLQDAIAPALVLADQLLGGQYVVTGKDRQPGAVYLGLARLGATDLVPLGKTVVLRHRVELEVTGYQDAFREHRNKVEGSLANCREVQGELGVVALDTKVDPGPAEQSGLL